MDHNIGIVLILTIGFGFASLLGYFAQRWHLPSILGYLIAGFIIGPYSPGFTGDIKLAEQLAEVGVILMLFSVGMHFKVSELVKVKNVAIPGAIIQTLAATVTTATLLYFLGWNLEAGVILGLAIGVASTVVLVRVLSDNHLLETMEGHIAVGWLIVEDILTVAVLILLPVFAQFMKGEELSFFDISSSIALMIIKFVILAILMFTWGYKLVSFLLTSVARLRSHELLTLTVVAIIFLIATGSAYIFGTSLALGAFIAGLVIGRTDVSHQAAANALSLRDIFTIVFFITVGMLFNPMVMVDHFQLFTIVLFVILIVKPLVAFLIVISFQYSVKAALVVAFALAQIGEFSFILAEQATNFNLLPEEGYDVVVAAAIISICLNPIIFSLLGKIEKKVQINRSINQLVTNIFKTTAPMSLNLPNYIDPNEVHLVVVGFGPIGRAVVHRLRKAKLEPTIIERNIDVVSENPDTTLQMIFGDASQQDILKSAKINQATYLIITIPDTSLVKEIIVTARQLNPYIRILTRVQYISEEGLCQQFRVDGVCMEKETLKAFLSKTQRLIFEIKSRMT